MNKFNRNEFVCPKCMGKEFNVDLKEKGEYIASSRHSYIEDYIDNPDYFTEEIVGIGWFGKPIIEVYRATEWLLVVCRCCGYRQKMMPCDGGDDE